MAIELEAPPRRFRRPVRRFYGRGYYGPVYQDPVVIEVERTEPAPALPWRVITISSWGATTEFSSGSAVEAVKFFKSYKWPSPPPYNIELVLQHWTGSGWKKEGWRNSTPGR